MRGISLIILLFTVQAVAHPASDTVATADLRPFFTITHRVGEPDVVASAALFREVNKNKLERVDLAPSETVIFAVGGVAVRFTSTLRLPYVDGASYAVVFGRANGELFTSQARFPGPVEFRTLPDLVSKNAPVEFSWRATEGRLVAVATSVPNCVHQAGLRLTGETTAELPAGYASTCLGETPGTFVTEYMSEPSGFAGLTATTITPLAFRWANDGAALPHTISAPSETTVLRVASIGRSGLRKSLRR